MQILILLPKKNEFADICNPITNLCNKALCHLPTVIIMLSDLKSRWFKTTSTYFAHEAVGDQWQLGLARLRGLGQQASSPVRMVLAWMPGMTGSILLVSPSVSRSGHVRTTVAEGKNKWKKTCKSLFTLLCIPSTNTSLTKSNCKSGPTQNQGMQNPFLALKNVH